MKLFIDDIRNAPDDTWSTCRTVLSAVRAIDQFGPEITHIALDHDISHEVIMDGLSRPYPCGETFEIVARYITLARRVIGPSFAPQITIHTSNPAGAERMAALLTGAGLSYEIRPAHPANRLEATEPKIP